MAQVESTRYTPQYRDKTRVGVGRKSQPQEFRPDRQQWEDDSGKQSSDS